MIKLKIKSDKYKQKGGNNDNIKNILIVSHGNRMRCLLSELFNKSITYKLMNTAILLFKIRTNSSVNLDVTSHYEGEVSEKSTETYKKIYYTNSDEYGIKFWCRHCKTVKEISWAELQIMYKNSCISERPVLH